MRSTTCQTPDRSICPAAAAPRRASPPQLINADDERLGELVGDYPFDISSITDDRPFFWHFTPYADVLTNFSRGMEDSEIAIGERLLLMLLVVAILVAAVLLCLPFLLSRRTAGDRPAGCPTDGDCSSTSLPSGSGSW